MEHSIAWCVGHEYECALEGMACVGGADVLGGLVPRTCVVLPSLCPGHTRCKVHNGARSGHEEAGEGGDAGRSFDEVKRPCHNPLSESEATRVVVPLFCCFVVQRGATGCLIVALWVDKGGGGGGVLKGAKNGSITTTARPANLFRFKEAGTAVEKGGRRRICGDGLSEPRPLP